MAKKKRDLSSALKQLRISHPNMVSRLAQAQENRVQHVESLKDGARLRGYEELIQHLIDLEPVFRKNRKLQPTAFLIPRARADFETALEAGLSGYTSVSHDAMRDVMEIEFLFREFYFEPQHIAQWVTCSDKERFSKFRPFALRQRHAKRLGTQPEDLNEASDYKGHSMFLHVNPYRNPFGGPGMSEASAIPFGHDSYFWEIFEHGRRLLFIAHRLRRKLARHLKSPHGPERGLKHFRDAWKRTQEMQFMSRALIEVMRDERTK